MSVALSRRIGLGALPAAQGGHSGRPDAGIGRRLAAKAQRLLPAATYDTIQSPICF
ncbi:hypothetical protein [Bradyrhizobium sp. USDA 3315]